MNSPGQDLSHTAIAAHLGRHRETIGPRLKGIVNDGLARIFARHAQVKSYAVGFLRILFSCLSLTFSARIRENPSALA